MKTYKKECCVQGYHVYKDTWEAAFGEELEYVREQSNAVDQYVVRGSIEGRHNRWPLTEDISIHLLVLDKRWCDTVSRCRKEKVFRLTSRFLAEIASPPQVLGEIVPL